MLMHPDTPFREAIERHAAATAPRPRTPLARALRSTVAATLARPFLRRRRVRTLATPA